MEREGWRLVNQLCWHPGADLEYDGRRLPDILRHPLSLQSNDPRSAPSDGAWWTVTDLLRPPVELDPLPRKLDPKVEATLSGRLLGEAQNPKVLSSDPRG